MSRNLASRFCGIGSASPADSRRLPVIPRLHGPIASDPFVEKTRRDEGIARSSWFYYHVEIRATYQWPDSGVRGRRNRVIAKRIIAPRATRICVSARTSSAWLV